MIPEGWTIKREQNNELFKSITITAPNGYAAYVSNIERNPANILYMLAEALLQQPLTQVSGEYGYPRHELRRELTTWTVKSIPAAWDTERASTCFAKSYQGEGSYYCPNCDANVGSVWIGGSPAPLKRDALCYTCRPLFGLENS